MENTWYIFTGIIGLILGVGSILCFICGVIFLGGILIALWEKEYDEIPFIAGIIVFCTIICSISLVINLNVVKYQKQISNEITNIVSYEGIANVKEGKFNYGSLYFTQGENNNYSVLKLSPNDCKLHYTDDTNIKIIKNHTEYLSKFRYLSLFCLDEKVNYDVYLPEKYRK